MLKRYVFFILFLTGAATYVKADVVLVKADLQQAINLAVDGPEADAEAARFARRPVKLPTRLLIIRATQDGRPGWMTGAPDHGWNERAATLLVRNVPADHLGVLAEPHVRVLAQAINEVSNPS